MSNYAKLSEQHLLLLLKEKDQLAFSELYDRTWHSLFKVAYQRLRDKEVCKDLVQDIYTDLWNKAGTRQIESLLPYLHTAVRYKIYTWVARGNGAEHFVEPFESMSVSAFSTDKWYELHELETLIDLWTDTLPEKRRKIFQLKYIDDLSTKEISEQLNISQKTVQNQLIRAFHELQGRVSHYLAVFAIFLNFQ